ncbi:MAG: hypothetical protein KA436_10725 [Oligoflexales bacterium]|nr:hypothetical protein [Oligoflexales bacterium]
MNEKRLRKILSFVFMGFNLSLLVLPVQAQAVSLTRLCCCGKKPKNIRKVRIHPAASAGMDALPPPYVPPLVLPFVCAPESASAVTDPVAGESTGVLLQIPYAPESASAVTDPVAGESTGVLPQIPCAPEGTAAVTGPVAGESTGVLPQTYDCCVSVLSYSTIYLGDQLPFYPLCDEDLLPLPPTVVLPETGPFSIGAVSSPLPPAPSVPPPSSGSVPPPSSGSVSPP